MELLVYGIAIGCAISVAVSLVAWIPPIRRMGQHSTRARKGLIFGLRLLAGISFWLLVAYGVAQATLIFSATGVGDDFASNHANFVYAEEVRQHWAVIRRETWLRTALPLPLRGTCFTGNDTACRWADQVGAGWTSDLWLDQLLALLISFGFPALLSGTLAWHATRRGLVAGPAPETR